MTGEMEQRRVGRKAQFQGQVEPLVMWFIGPRGAARQAGLHTA